MTIIIKLLLFIAKVVVLNNGSINNKIHIEDEYYKLLEEAEKEIDELQRGF